MHKNQGRKLLVASMGIWMIPLCLTILLSGKMIEKENLDEDVEKYIPVIMMQEIPWDYEEEMLKVQATLVRSSLYYYLEQNKEGSQKERLDQYIQNYTEFNMSQLYNISYQETQKRMEQAVKDTKNMVLIYEDTIIPGIFHRISAGRTRNSAEIAEHKGWEYLVAADSMQDLTAEDYDAERVFSPQTLFFRLEEAYPGAVVEEELFEQITIKKTDSSGYVLEIQVGTNTISGEDFRKKMQLPSSHFSIEKRDHKIVFCSKGIGHGMGLSQFGGNVLAQKGKSYQEILLHYFPDTVLGNVKNFV